MPISDDLQRQNNVLMQRYACHIDYHIYSPVIVAFSFMSFFPTSCLKLKSDVSQSVVLLNKKISSQPSFVPKVVQSTGEVLWKVQGISFQQTCLCKVNIYVVNYGICLPNSVVNFSLFLNVA
jgi:hypothetical protein